MCPGKMKQEKLLTFELLFIKEIKIRVYGKRQIQVENFSE